MPRKKKVGIELASQAQPDPGLEADLSQPADLPPFEDRIEEWKREAVSARSRAGVRVPKGTGRPKTRGELPEGSAPPDEGPFTESGCRSILASLMFMLSRWAKCPILEESKRITEGAKLHAEILNRYAPPPIKDKAPVVMLGGWWAGVLLDVGMSRLSKGALPSGEDSSLPTAVVVDESLSAPAPQVNLDRNRKPYQPTEGQAISG